MISFVTTIGFCGVDPGHSRRVTHFRFSVLIAIETYSALCSCATADHLLITPSRYTVPGRIVAVEECDATGLDSSNAAKYINFIMIQR